jgi:hypothetical protein
MCSGVVLCDEVHWVTFHSGYDFGYIIKLLTCKPLPAEEDEFFAELLLYCPHVSFLFQPARAANIARCSMYCPQLSFRFPAGSPCQT